MKRSTARAIMSVEDAMTSVERAQRNLDTAAQALSHVRRGSAEYGRILKAHELVHRLWYRLQALSRKPGLTHDSENP